MRLTNTTWISVDGVMQGLGAAEEDRRGGFERGGWAMPHADPEVEAALNEVYVQADAFLFGRWTYDVFAGSWGTVPEMKDSAVGQALNTKPKYVVSSTLADPGWAGTTVLSGDLAAAIGKLKAEGEGQLLVPGSRTLTRWLLENDLFDEINLFTAPVVVGQGDAAVPRHRAGPGARADRIADHRQRRGHPHLPDERSPAVRGDAGHHVGLE